MEENASRPQPASADDEIIQLRERLAFYESFDQVIHDNVANASDLLRKAAASREAAQRALNEASAQSLVMQKQDRSRFRDLFAAMLDEVTTLQGQLERLARRVADTLDDLESDIDPHLPEPVHLHPLSSVAEAQPLTSTEPSQETQASAGETGEGIAAPPETAAEEPTAPGVTSEDLDASEPFDDDEVHVEPFQPDAATISDQPATPVAPAAASTEPPIDEPSHQAEGTGGATILVHGVPRATTALSLKRFLEGLPEVDHVEPREYAEGVLRLLVVGRRPVSLKDLLSWPDGAALEPINIRGDLLEVRLNH